MLPLQRLAARVLRHHVGGDEDVLGANQRRVDEDVGDGGRGWRGCRDEKSSEGLKLVRQQVRRWCSVRPAAILILFTVFSLTKWK